MCAPTYQKGQPAIVSEPGNPAGRHGSKDDTVHEVIVTSVGPQWITLTTAAGRRFRFDHNHEPEESAVGDYPELWPTREAYDWASRRQRAWHDLLSTMRGLGDPPDHLSGADIDAITKTLKGA